jgi:hypothetical protein
VTAILVLLALVSIAGLTARVGGLELLLGSTLPALFIGFLAGPSGLGYIDRALADGLGLGRDAAVAWLGLSAAVGLVTRVRRRPAGSAAQSPDRPALARAVAVLALGVFAAALLTALTARALDVMLTPGAIATLALVGAAVLLPFVDDRGPLGVALDALAIVALVAAIALGAPPSVAFATLATAAVGVLLGIVAHAVVLREPARRVPALAATLVVATGLALAAGVHPGLVGVATGLGAAIVDRGPALAALVSATREPMRLVTAALIGLVVEPSVASTVVGCSLALGISSIVAALAPRRGASEHAALRGARASTGSGLRAIAEHVASSSAGLFILGGVSARSFSDPSLGAIAPGALATAVIVADALALAVVVGTRRPARSAP